MDVHLIVRIPSSLFTGIAGVMTTLPGFPVRLSSRFRPGERVMVSLVRHFVPLFRRRLVLLRAFDFVVGLEPFVGLVVRGCAYDLLGTAVIDFLPHDSLPT